MVLPPREIRYSRSSSFAHRSCPANDRFLSGADSPIADPRYLANGLFALTGRTFTPVLSSSNSKTSPARTPSALRMARGTVIRPFDVIFACFSNAPALPGNDLQFCPARSVSIRVDQCKFSDSSTSSDPQCFRGFSPRLRVSAFEILIGRVSSVLSVLISGKVFALRCHFLRHQRPVINPQQQCRQHADGDHRPPHFFRLMRDLAKVVDQLPAKPSGDQ